ncbi:hypothetical protein [uncultured Oscillibacter sp.]|uniref:hypothetical protein n=1 Tax=uncultured Oscillibacter sp. TaxID=876091 RepID=UPI00262CC356|nr:hypothetical protein [uncultured Oscillibacter sp.]
MASFGAKNPYFRKIKEEPEGKLPVYEDNPVKIGRLVKADVTLQMASGKLYADDELAESVDEFVSGSLAMETDDMLDDVASEVYGVQVEGKQVRYNIQDDPPPGGLAYYKKLMRRRRVLYKGIYFPLVKASLGSDTASTKTDSITFGTTNTTFIIFPCNSGDWRFTEEFATEEEAIAWVKAFTPASADANTGGGTGGTELRHASSKI